MRFLIAAAAVTLFGTGVVLAQPAPPDCTSSLTRCVYVAAVAHVVAPTPTTPTPTTAPTPEPFSLYDYMLTLDDLPGGPDSWVVDDEDSYDGEAKARLDFDRADGVVFAPRLIQNIAYRTANDRAARVEQDRIIAELRGKGWRAWTVPTIGDRARGVTLTTESGFVGYLIVIQRGRYVTEVNVVTFGSSNNASLTLDLGRTATALLSAAP